MTTFELGAGALCLDFVNTLDDRPSQTPVECIPTYGDLVEFARQAGALTQVEATRLMRAAGQRAQEADAVAASARAVREALFRILSAWQAGGSIDPADLAILNAALATSRQHERLQADGERFRWSWPSLPDGATLPLDYPLWPLARSAGHVLTSGLRDRIRSCAADDCGVLFLDTTRNASRRWCSDQTCGNRARVRKHRQRNDRRTQS
jgi:predicted RNA-binding Zn ribbon-like protein